MLVTRPLYGLFPGPLARVLEVLHRTDVPLTGRGVADLVTPRMSHATAQAALRHLSEQGVVERRPAGRAYTHLINREHMLVQALGPWLSGAEALVQRLRDHHESWGAPSRALWIFGSVASGRDTVDSDIDVMAIRPDDVDADDAAWWEWLTDLSLRIGEWTGNPCDVVEFAEAEAREQFERGEALLVEVFQAAATVAGPSPQEVLDGR